ncbi:protein lingerer isoform X2 [Contarinia nasturtii]|nr:protein lingerer isoform X2 [Contarinia nasturtii]XP_031635900.1 protein lingerer isoform X2 [Contarinia nasturtii]
MSTQTRSSGGGRNQTNKKNTSTTGGGGGGNETNFQKKSDHAKTDKEKPQLHVKQPTAEQIRIAQITEISTGSDDPKMREKVANLMETTQRTEEEVCCALYECDNDLDRAVIFLLEQLPVGAFETSSKKKKNRLAGTGDAAATDGEWNENNNAGNSGTNNNSNNNADYQKNRNRGGNVRVGRGNSDSRGWRGRESRENERNAGGSGDNKSNQNSGPRRGPPNSFRNGGFGAGRGGRSGGRLGPRSSRDQNRGNYFRSQDENETAVDTWDNNIALSAAEQTKSDDTWGDWDNEEYTGSLADTKVFTPSTVQNQTLSHAEQLSAPPGLEQQILSPPSQLTNDDLVQQYSANTVSSTPSAVSVGGGSGVGGVATNNNSNQVQYSDLHVQSSTNASHLRPAIDIPLNSSSLSAEQSQYFNSLSSQPVSAVQYSSPYAYKSNINDADQVVAGQPQIQPVANRNSKRARVPPPSKIPSSAVEMPDTLSNIGYLDVQFGALDFGSEETFDSISDKFQSSNIVDNSQNVTASDVSSDYQSKSQGSNSLNQSQLISNPDSLAGQSENLSSSGYSQRQNSSVVQTQTASANTLANASAALEQLTKSDHYVNQSNVNATSVSGNGASTAGTYQTYTKTSTVYQPSNVTPQGYNNSNYANTQTASNSSNYSSSTNTYNSYNQGSVNSYQTQQSNLTNSVNNSSSVTNVSNSGSTSVGNTTSVNNASSSANTGYLSNQYPSSQTSSVYPTQASAYQNNPNCVYGSSSLNNNNSGYTGNTNTSTSQYSSFSGSKINKDSTPVTTIYDSTLSSSTQSVGANNSASNTSGNSNSSLSSPSIGLTNTKVTNSTAKSTGGGNVVSNIPMVSQYIPTGMPFYQQPVYSYEDIQMLQQRIPPHVPAGYYDINYQTPTSLGASGVRDGNLGSVAYSTMSDGRFTRTDNNSSPVSNVPSTMSQQTGSGGPMLNLPYAYFYGANMMPGSYQFGTPALYPQQLATNASSNAQFAKPSYNSAYGSSGYDALGQSTQEYTKTAYPGSGTQQSKGQNVSNQPPSGTGSDISSSMYGNKNHAALSKVNSYEKGSFHSNTPPPFGQNAGATSQYGAQQLYIQAMPAALHNMNLPQHIHQMDGRVYNSSKRDSNNAGQRQQTSSQGKSSTKQGYSPSYWTAQN